MNDIRKNAEERAARAAPKPAGSNFETERQKQKNALAMQIDSLDESKVRKIAADTEKESEKRQLLVAAYCRVSTDDIDQRQHRIIPQ